MTVRSKQHPKAEIVTLPSGRHTAAARTVSIWRRCSDLKPGSTATLLSLREHLTLQASVGVTNLDSIGQEYSPQAADQVMMSIRGLLDREFGHLRVHRRHRVFIVKHHSMESLIAGLLAVQFHSCEVNLQVSRGVGVTNDLCGVPLSWGVGRSRAEAEGERLRKQNG
ncbi:MAG: hypothetical protein AB8B64_24380 [Granulosicoccus sp.]